MTKIAVPITNTNQIDSHFGHCESYSIFTISAINNIKSPQGCGCNHHEGNHAHGHTCNHN
jgi:predicted Fe-Mo cluster-binding NifX family protein